MSTKSEGGKLLGQFALVASAGWLLTILIGAVSSKSEKDGAAPK